jgi:hypothetical protein
MGQAVICARVARHIVYRAYRVDEAFCPFQPIYARLAARSLPLDYPGMLRLALHSLAVYLDLGYSSSLWLECVLRAAHDGHSFRRCFFFDYKANRSPYPRVTNRGVQTSIPLYQLPLEED